MRASEDFGCVENCLLLYNKPWLPYACCGLHFWLTPLPWLTPLSFYAPPLHYISMTMFVIRGNFRRYILIAGLKCHSSIIYSQLSIFSRQSSVVNAGCDYCHIPRSGTSSLSSLCYCFDQCSDLIWWWSVPIFDQYLYVYTLVKSCVWMEWVLRVVGSAVWLLKGLKGSSLLCCGVGELVGGNVGGITSVTVREATTASFHEKQHTHDASVFSCNLPPARLAD